MLSINRRSDDMRIAVFTTGSGSHEIQDEFDSLASARRHVMAGRPIAVDMFGKVAKTWINPEQITAIREVAVRDDQATAPEPATARSRSIASP
jgi:hypothetical protein